MNVEQELGIGPEVHESGSLCEAFFCPDITQNVFFLSFLYWDTEPAAKKVEMCGDR